MSVDFDHVSVTFPGDRKAVYDAPLHLKTLAAEAELQPGANTGPLMGIRVNGLVVSLNKRVATQDVRVEPVFLMSPEGASIYRRTLAFVVCLAASRDLHGGYLCSVNRGQAVTEEEVGRLRGRVEQAIAEDAAIEERHVGWQAARDYFAATNRPYSLSYLETTNYDSVRVCACAGFLSLWMRSLAPGTGVLGSSYSIARAEDGQGFALMFPHEAESQAPLSPKSDLREDPVLTQVYREYNGWGRLLGVECTGDLNKKIASNESKTFVAMNEALHNHKIVEIAQAMHKRVAQLRMVLIAGPSASGKTTFAGKLSIQLQILGLQPVVLSVDNYFKPRHETPRDENGEYDFEALEALRVDTLNDHLVRLLRGETVDTPIFDFHTGLPKRETIRLALPANGILIMEGIHMLNDKLTASVPREAKYKVFLAPLSQLNVDECNFASHSVARLIRRINRDYNHRGYSAADTLGRWASVTRGEEKHILPFLRSADTVFNTALDYETSVLKTYVAPLLRTIRPGSDVYNAARNLEVILDMFFPIPHDDVPPNSLLREFIGGSFFDVAPAAEAAAEAQRKTPSPSTSPQPSVAVAPTKVVVAAPPKLRSLVGSSDGELSPCLGRPASAAAAGAPSADAAPQHDDEFDNAPIPEAPEQQEREAHEGGAVAREGSPDSGTDGDSEWGQSALARRGDKYYGKEEWATARRSKGASGRRRRTRGHHQRVPSLPQSVPDRAGAQEAGETVTPSRRRVTLAPITRGGSAPPPSPLPGLGGAGAPGVGLLAALGPLRRPRALTPAPESGGGGDGGAALQPLQEVVPEDQRERLRQQCIREIITTEQAYLEDLRIIQEVFLMPIRFTHVLDDEQVAQLFSNVEMLSPVHKEVLEKLRDEKVMQCQYFKMYSAYCANQDQALRLLDQLKRENPEFAKALSVCHSDSRAKGIFLNGYIIKPVQRICKYPLFFRELLKYTPETHADYKELVEARDKIDEVVKSVNESKRKYEQQQKIMEIRNEVEGVWEEELVQVTRKFVSEAQLRGVDLRTQKEHEYKLYLFQDLLVIAKIAAGVEGMHHRKPLVLKGYIPISQCRVVVLADTYGVKNAFEIHRTLPADAPAADKARAPAFQLYARTESERTEAIKAIRSLVKDQYNKRIGKKSQRANSIAATL
eukprot:m51a1_g5899 putative phosphoribulokinase uridine kinase family protein (1154) ;mRNA; f:552325-557990